MQTRVVLPQLASSQGWPAGSLDGLTKILTALYRTLGATSAHLLAGKRGPGARAGGARSLPPPFLDLVAWVNSSCTPAVYAWVQAAAAGPPSDRAGVGGENQDGNAGPAHKRRKHAAAGSGHSVARRVKKEASLVPHLIFSIEEHEKHLIKLSKAGARIFCSGRELGEMLPSLVRPCVPRSGCAQPDRFPRAHPPTPPLAPPEQAT